MHKNSTAYKENINFIEKMWMIEVQEKEKFTLVSRCIHDFPW